MTSSFRQPITLRHLSPGSYVDGNWVEGTYIESTIYASVQPASNNDMQSLPQGRRENRTFKLFTQTLLQSVDCDNPDIVILMGQEYEITTVDAWQNTELAHYECLATRKMPK